jgi:hypothetical protein
MKKIGNTYYLNKKDEKRFNERLATHDKVVQKAAKNRKKIFANMLGISVKKLESILTIK